MESIVRSDRPVALVVLDHDVDGCWTVYCAVPSALPRGHRVALRVPEEHTDLWQLVPQEVVIDDVSADSCTMVTLYHPLIRQQVMRR